MTAKASWETISARITSLVDAGTLFVQGGNVDHYRISEILLSDAHDTGFQYSRFLYRLRSRIDLHG